MAKRIMIAASGQHIGKTTCTLGIVVSLMNKGYDVGYCKPVGQQHLTINGKLADKDTVLFGNFLNFQVDPQLHSPVIIGSGVTTKFLDNPEQFQFKEHIAFAKKELEAKHEIVVYEGTGHPGVGSIIQLSNAQVAKALDAAVILVIEGGIGRTIDKLNMSLSLFREQGIEIKGIIINKVHTDKFERIKKYLTKAVQHYNVPILGLVPYDQTLSHPIMSTIAQSVFGKVMYHVDQLDNRVQDILAGSLIEIDDDVEFQNLLLVVNHSRFTEAIQKVKILAHQMNLEKCPLSGVVVTGDGRQNQWYDPADFADEYLQQHRVPILTTTLDTYDTVVKISKIEVKINTHTPWKVYRAIELIQDHVDLSSILEEAPQTS
ncbi:MAG: AAA family ATPase [Saprospiraceae bacterium]|nr:AAA family ATPase [Saprospiraceae bacterium]